ncbi:MAG TPA: hypothetical protein VM409_06150 [Chloroflexia bacterium]|nr:hypothetical protein [Chloroflexia bacterium]
MILQSRKWRLLIRAITLLVTSVLMLAFAGPASYALQDDTPRLITSPAQLTSTERPVTNSFASAKGLPNIATSFATEAGSDTYFWIPLEGYGNRLLVRTKNPTDALPDNFIPGVKTEVETNYTGKVTTLESQPGSKEVLSALKDRGINAEKGEVMVLQQGEKPSTYRPMVPVFPVLAWLWLAALAGLIQIGRGRQSRRRFSSASVAARNPR